MMSRVWVHCALLLLIATAPALSRQDSSLGRFPHRLVTDPPAMIHAARGAELRLAGSSLLLLVPLSLMDEPLRRAARPDEGQQPAGALRVVDHLGGPWGLAGSIALFGGTLLTDDVTLQNTAFSSVQAAAYAGATVLLLKWSIGRSRPSAEQGAFHFRPGRSFYDAFPSGHTAVAFAMTVPWVRSYPASPSWLLLVAAAGTGAARIAYDRHWLTDVVGGALLGAAMGYAVTGRRLTDK